MPIDNKKEQAKKIKMQGYSVRRKGTSGSVMKLSSVFKEIFKKLKKSLMLNGIVGVVIPGLDTFSQASNL